MKSAVIRFTIGYLISDLTVAIYLAVQGDHLRGILIGLSLWAPVAVCSLVVSLLALGMLRIRKLIGSAELCGLCTGAFSLFSGLWPTYMWGLDMALRFLAIQCLALSGVILFLWIVYKMIGR
jgi:hypothetical protein